MYDIKTKLRHPISAKKYCTLNWNISAMMFLLTSYFIMTFYIRYNLDFGEVKKEKEMDRVSFNLLWLK